MTTPTNILLVEDDHLLRQTLADNLRDEGYCVAQSSTLAAAQAELDAGSPQIIILDVMLPDGDGYGACQRWRSAGLRTPILMLTARTLDEDIVRGFDVGADDYVEKPYRLGVLLARVKALIRRGHAAAAQRSTFGGLSIDHEARTVRLEDGHSPHLTRTEFDLLVYFSGHCDRALDRQELIGGVWGRDVAIEPKTVDNTVFNLKRKLAWHSGSNFVFTSIRGIGYRFETPDH